MSPPASAASQQSSEQTNLDPARLCKDSYDFSDLDNSFQTAFEIADTLEDYFRVARDDKLSEAQLESLVQFLDDKTVFHAAAIVIPEVAKLAGADEWVQEKVNGVRSTQVAHLLDATAHRASRYQGSTQPTKIQTEEQRAEVLRQAQEVVDATNAKIWAAEDAERDANNATSDGTRTCGWSECSKPARLRCSRCKNVYYCDQACQRHDWASHKKCCRRPLPTMKIVVGKMTTLGDLIRDRGDAGRISWRVRRGAA